MKYKSPRESDNLSEVLAVIFNDSKRVPKIAEELGISESTIYKRLNALKRENLVEEEDHKYQLNKDKLYEEFWRNIAEEIRFNDESQKAKFQVVKDQIKGNGEFRRHLLGFIETELQLTSTPIKEIFAKYKDRLEIRYDFVYQLTHNQIESTDVSEEKEMFWKHLQIIQAYLPHAAWTEPVHGTALESQVYPGEEQKMDAVDDMWRELVEIANKNLENLAEVSE